MPLADDKRSFSVVCYHGLRRCKTHMRTFIRVYRDITSGLVQHRLRSNHKGVTKVNLNESSLNLSWPYEPNKEVLSWGRWLKILHTVNLPKMELKVSNRYTALRQCDWTDTVVITRKWAKCARSEHNTVDNLKVKAWYLHKNTKVTIPLIACCN